MSLYSHGYLYFHVDLYFRGFLHLGVWVNEKELSLGSFFKGNYWSDVTLVISGQKDIPSLPYKLCLFLISSAILCRQNFFLFLKPVYVSVLLHINSHLSTGSGWDCWGFCAGPGVELDDPGGSLPTQDIP